jgi:hypothetical protein
MKDKIREAIHHITKPEITQDDLNVIYFTLIELHREVLRGSIADTGNSEQARNNNAVLILISRAEHIADQCCSFYNTDPQGIDAHVAAKNALRHFKDARGSISIGVDHLQEAIYCAGRGGLEL